MGKKKWVPKNGEEIWTKVFSNWSKVTYIGFDTVSQNHISSATEIAGGNLYRSKDILPLSDNPNNKIYSMQSFDEFKKTFDESFAKVTPKDFVKKLENLGYKFKKVKSPQRDKGNTMEKPQFPKPPLSRMLRDGVFETCDKCDSSVKRKYNLFFFEAGHVIGCIHPECENYFKNNKT